MGVDPADANSRFEAVLAHAVGPTHKLSFLRLLKNSGKAFAIQVSQNAPFSSEEKRIFKLHGLFVPQTVSVVDMCLDQLEDIIDTNFADILTKLNLNAPFLKKPTTTSLKPIRPAAQARSSIFVGELVMKVPSLDFSDHKKAQLRNKKETIRKKGLSPREFQNPIRHSS
ncbi:hypothetical protein HDU97_002995 [Phlyctochytrium planicorne]|nr:hypothetical protein HDU97_002995 [Phlyctochytrium planicorne]